MAVVQAAAKYTSLHFIPSFHERLPPLTRSNFLLPRNDGVRLYPLPLRSTFPSFDNPKPYRLFKFRFCLPEASSKSRIEKNDLQFEVLENNSEEALLRATANLRVRTFYDFKQSYGVEEHCQYMSGLELEALKERIAGKRLGFKRVACIIATLCTSKTLNVSEDFYSACKAMINDKELLVVGSVDLNQSNQLPDEIPGSRPEGAAADFTRAYLTNVCVANELHRNGIGTELIVQAVKVAYQWVRKHSFPPARRRALRLPV